MAVTTSMLGSIISHGAGNITVSGAGTGATWGTSGIQGIQAENLVEPLVELTEYFESRNFKGWDECYEYFKAIGKLNNTFVSELMNADIRQWKASKCK